MSIGLLGEYLARIYDEVKERPLFIVRRRFPDRPRRIVPRRPALVRGAMTSRVDSAFRAGWPGWQPSRPCSPSTTSWRSPRASQKSMTFDEMAHLTGGYTYWAFDDYRLHPENGNWPQRLGALPAVLGGAVVPPARSARLDDVERLCRSATSSCTSAATMPTPCSRRGRAVMALLGVALGALVYAWARRLVSPAGAWVSLLLFVFSPTFLAHGPLVTSDMAAALFFTAAVGAMWTVAAPGDTATVARRRGALAGRVSVEAVGADPGAGRDRDAGGPGRSAAGLSSSRSGVAPSSTQVARVSWPSSSASLVVFGLVTWALIWASYGFRYTAFPAANDRQGRVPRPGH